MPRNGIFVAMEWIVDKPPVLLRTMEGEPGHYIGLIKTDNANSCWIGTYNKSKWEKVQTHSLLSISLTVANYD